MNTHSIEHQRYRTGGSLGIHPGKERSIGMLQIITTIKKVENIIKEHATVMALIAPVGNDDVTLVTLSAPVGNDDVRLVSLVAPAGNSDVRLVTLSAPAGNEYVWLVSLVAPAGNKFVPQNAQFSAFGYILTNFALHYLSMGWGHTRPVIEIKPRRQKNAERSKNMAKTSYKQSSIMLKYQTILDNIRKTDMLDPLLERGFDSTTIDEGDALLSAGKSAIEAQKQAHSEKIKTTRALSILERAVKGTFADHVRMARRALSDAENHIKDLGISGKMGRSLADWTETAKAFYSTALATPEILAKLARFNITDTVLQQGLDDIAGLLTVNSDQEDKKGIAQQKTELKKKAIEAIEKWIGDLLTVCRIAYKDDPQKLERLTITVYSEGYKPKKPGFDPGTTPTEPTDPTDPTDPSDPADPGQGGETPGT